MLQVEKLGRDMIAGKPISDANAKILNEHFKVPIDPITGLRIDKDGRTVQMRSTGLCSNKWLLNWPRASR